MQWIRTGWIAAFVSLIAFLSCGAYAFLRIGLAVRDVPAVVTHLNGTLTRAEEVESKLYATAGNLDKATATWAASSKDQAAAVTALTADAHQTLVETRDAIAQADTTLATVDAQAKHLGPAIDSIQASFDAATPAVKQINQDVADLDTTIKATSALTGAATARIDDPHIDDLVKHLDGMSASSDKMLADAQWKTHQLLHPDKVKLGFWGTVDFIVRKYEPALF